MKKNRISVTPSFLFPLAFLFWGSPMEEILLFLFAVFLHEGGHLFAIYLFGEKAKKLSLSVAGASIALSSEYVPYKKEMLIYLAGPFGNLLGMIFSLFLLRVEFTKQGMFFFFCNALLAIFNLLPIRGLDGERALFSLLCLFLDMEKGEKICFFLGKATLFILFLLSLHLFFKEKNPSLLLLTVSLFTENKRKNTFLKNKKVLIP